LLQQFQLRPFARREEGLFELIGQADGGLAELSLLDQEHQRETGEGRQHHDQQAHAGVLPRPACSADIRRLRKGGECVTLGMGVLDR